MDTAAAHTTNSQPEPAIDYRKLAQSLRTAQQTLATMAPGLTDAELRVALFLWSVADQTTNIVVASSRQVAAGTRLARSNVVRAIDSLTRRCFITTRQGTATRSSTYRLNWPALQPLPGVVLQQDHPPVQNLPGVVLRQDHPSEPPIDVFDSSIDPEGIIDRMLRARPTHFPKSDLAKLREWIHGYQAKFGRAPNPHPPDDFLLAQLLALAPLDKLINLTYDLMGERKEPGSSWAWWTTVALQRIHGITPQQTKARRAQLRVVRHPQTNTPDQAAQDDIQAQIADLSRRKAI